MSSWLSTGFQDSCSLSMCELFCLHDYVMVIMLSVVVFIFYISSYFLFSSYYYKFLSESTFIEVIWSVIPTFILVALVLPSMKLLYIMEDFKSPALTFKVVAHQWYWTYVVPLFKNMSYYIGSISTSVDSYEFDSILDSSSFPRLLGCSDHFYVPVNTTSRFLVGSTDVIHSFSVPAMGLKVDAVPGRINQLFCTPSRLGSFLGQCSEICGSNHSFMPISVKVCPLSDYDYVTKYYTLDSVKSSFSFDGNFF